MIDKAKAEKAIEVSLVDEMAERAVIGSLVANYQHWTKLLGVVSGSDFDNRRWGMMFDGIIALSQAGVKLSDFRVMVLELKSMGIEAVDIARFINEAAFSEAQIFFAERVRRLANLRRMQQTALELLQDCASLEADDAKVAAATSAKLAAMAAGGVSQTERFGDVADRVVSRLRAPKEQIAGKSVMTGLSSLDEIAGAIRPGELVVIAARPGIGKTALAMQIAEHNAHKGRHSMFVTLEMTADELVTRTLASQAEVSSMRIRSETLSDPDIASLASAAVDGQLLPIHIHAPAKATLANIDAAAKVCSAKCGGLALLVVDYIGLIEPRDRRQKKYEAVDESAQGLKQLAKDLGLAIICLCQLNRETDKAEVPKLSNLSDSSGVEKAADMVWFIHLPGGRKSVSREGEIKAHILVAKHRHGSIGNAELIFKPELTRFSEQSHEWNPNAYR